MKKWTYTGLFHRGLDPTPQTVLPYFEVETSPGSGIIASFVRAGG